MKRWFLGLLALAAPADAAVIRYEFGGTLQSEMTAGVFAAEAGLGGGAGSYSGYIVFDSEAPNLGGAAELYQPSEFLFSIGIYAFSLAQADFALASIDPAAPSFTLNFQASRDFSPTVDGEFLNFSILFAQAVPGLVQAPDIATGIADLTLIGDGDLLLAGGGVTQLNLVSAVPEPAVWTMMIADFALVGASLRGRRSISTARA